MPRDVVDYRNGVILYPKGPGGYSSNKVRGEYPPSPLLLRRALERGFALSDSAAEFLEYESDLRSIPYPLDPTPLVSFPQLFPHQSAAVRFLWQQKRVLLADDVGLGKTAQSLISALGASGGAPILFLTKAPLISQVADEVRTWIPSYEPLPLASDVKKRQEKYVQGSKTPRTVVIINWEALSTFTHKTLNLGWQTVIGDEAHYVKNRKTNRSEAAAQVAGSSVNLYLLTGTPLENTPGDLWHLVHMLRPQLFRSYWRWYNFFVDYETAQWGGYHKIKGAKNVEILHDLLQPIYLRRKRTETLALNEPQLIEVKVRLSPEQRRIYNLFQKESYLGDPYDITIDNEMARYTYLRQLAVDATALSQHQIPSGKLAALRALVESLPESTRIVIFSAYRQPAARAAEQEKAYLFEAGDKNSPSEILRTHRILSSTFGTLAAGANLQAAGVAIFLDLPWSSTLFQQAVGRISRIGQQEQPIIYYLTAEDTVDEYVADLVKRKVATFNEVLITQALKHR